MSKLFEKVKEEFFALPPTIFFFITLHLVAVIRVLMLKGTGIPGQHVVAGNGSASSRSSNAGAVTQDW